MNTPESWTGEVAGAAGGSFLASAGQVLAAAWIGYGVLLVISTLLGLNLAALAWVGHLALRNRPAAPRLRWLLLPVELLYGLIHPLAYLLIFVRTSGDGEFFHDVQPSWLDPPAWLLLVALWSLRIAPVGNAERLRRRARPLLAAGLALLAAYALRDLAAVMQQPPPVLRNLAEGGGWTMAISYAGGLAALYLVPAALLLRHLRSAACPQRWQLERAFALASRKVGTGLSIAVLAGVGTTAVLLQLRPAADEVRQRLLSQRAEVLAAGERTGTDPRLLAALVYTVQRRQGSAFGDALERLSTAAWLVDSGSQALLSDALNFSIGLAQIKPVTAQTALAVIEAGAREPRRRHNPKEYRDLPRLGPTWGLGEEALAGLEPGGEWFPGKREVAEGLLTDAGSLEMAALLLELHARQWERASPAWSIRRRPEILATLYQLGFERSVPKADPRASAFGEQVVRVMSSPWLREAFPAGGESPSPAGAAAGGGSKSGGSDTSK